ncbi:sporulation domain protein [Oceaniovalibus guishaninsula JLT2003]|uniref:Sporulation domain protein n=1 Tax=Oceaniovalibus guishaninsula JLT2003 TaxID=1231392 RepID=K2HS79_9RHOB|nr:SPOR domain-containing protein [Oceaniovalibus guishaninsula]EKE45544.1 sporulation domain protein [Oceaniovalibus guishaninsula JLT2003]
MTEFDYEADDAFVASQTARGGRMQRMASLSGGIVSIALIAGLGVWGYKLMVRDVTGIPVILALEGPVRIQPEDPGGDQAAHQGLAVNEIPAVGIAGATAEAVHLAPPAPPLADDDVAMGELVAEADEVPPVEMPLSDIAPESVLGDLIEEGMDEGIAEAPSIVAEIIPAPEEAVEPEVVEIVEAKPEADDATAIDRAVAEALGATLDLADLAEETAVPPAALAVPSAAILERSPRPMMRSSAVRVAALSGAGMAQGVLSAPLSGAVEVSLTELPPGTGLAQLGAYPDEDTARAQWGMIGSRFEEYFVGKRRVIQRAESGGQVFYRLRAEGFADLADARRFCAALLAEQADCIPVELR